jgi:hypothetical protein
MVVWTMVWTMVWSGRPFTLGLDDLLIFVVFLVGAGGRASNRVRRARCTLTLGWCRRLLGDHSPSMDKNPTERDVGGPWVSGAYGRWWSFWAAKPRTGGVYWRAGVHPRDGAGVAWRIRECGLQRQSGSRPAPSFALGAGERRRGPSRRGQLPGRRNGAVTRRAMTRSGPGFCTRSRREGRASGAGAVGRPRGGKLAEAAWPGQATLVLIGVASLAHLAIAGWHGQFIAP